MITNAQIKDVISGVSNMRLNEIKVMNEMG